MRGSCLVTFCSQSNSRLPVFLAVCNSLIHTSRFPTQVFPWQSLKVALPGLAWQADCQQSFYLTCREQAGCLRVPLPITLCLSTQDTSVMQKVLVLNWDRNWC